MSKSTSSTMPVTEVQWIGASCGRHSSYTFYRGFTLTVDGVVKNFCLGEFYFVRNSINQPICIAELQLVWHDASTDSQLASARLYFRPEDTPAGRLGNHGQDELLYADQKVVIKCHDMAVWQDSGLQWNSGLVPLCESDFVCIDHKYYLNSNYAVKEKETLQNAKEVWMKGDHPRKLQILTFPAYCRYRGLKKRLLSGMCLTRAQLVALGGVIAENKSTRVLFCRDSFHHPYLDKFELSGDNKAPVLKGRPRKKKKLNAAQNSVLKKKRFVADIQNHLVTNSHAAKRCKLSEEEESTGSDMSEGVLERTKAPPQVGRKVQSIGPPPLVKPRVQVTIPDKAETVEIPEVAAKDATQSRGETPKVPPPLIPSNIIRGDVVRTPQPLQSSCKHSNGNITECSRTTPIQKVICASSTKLRDLQKVNNNNSNNYSNDALMIKPHLTERSQTKATVAPVTSSSPTSESKPGRIMNSLVENRKVSKPGTTVTHTQSLSSGVRTIPTVQTDVHSHSVSRTRPLTTTQGTVSTHLVTSTCPVVRDQPIASLQQPNISIQTVAPKPQQTLTPLVGSKSSSVNTCDGMTASGDLYVRSKPSKENEERQLRLGISEEKKENEIDQTDESVAWKKKKKRLRMPGNVKDEEYDGDDEKDFMQALRDFMRKNNQPLGKLPALGFKKVNLWTMYCTTQKFGGYDAVTSKRLWRRVYDSLGGSTTITSAATYTRRHYERLLLPYEKHVRNQLKKQMDEKNPSLVNSLPPNQPLDKPEKKQGLTVSNKAKQETNKAAVLKQNQGAVEDTPTRLPQDVIAVSSVQSPPYMMKTTTDLKASEVKTTESGQVHTVMASSESKTSFKQGVSPVAVQTFKQEHEEPKTCSSNSKTGAAPPITSATEKQNRDTPTDQRTTEKRPQDTTQQNRKYIKTMQSNEDASLATSTMYAKNTTAANSNLKQSVQAVPIQRVFRGVHDDNLMPPTPQLLNSVSKGREIIDLTSDDSPPRSQSKSHLVPHVQGSQANAQDLSKMQRCGSADTEGRRHGHKSQMRQEYHESSKRHHPAREVQTSGEVPSVYDMQTYSVQPFNNNRVARQVQDSSPTIKKSKDEGYPLVKQETFPPKHDKKRHQQPRVESLEGRYTHSPSSDSADEHFAEWFRRQSNVQHHRPKCSVSHHMSSPNPELGQFRYGYVSEDMRATDCSCSLPTSRKDEIVSVPPTKSKKEHYEEDLPFPGIAMYPGRWSPSMVTDHPDLYISSHPPHLGVPPDALASHLCTPSRIFIPTAQIFSPPYHMGMAPMGGPPLIAGTDDQLHIHPHCLMASSYPRSSSSRTPDGTGYPLYSFT